VCRRLKVAAERFDEQGGMNETARRYWDEILDLHAPVETEPRRAPVRKKLLRVRRPRVIDLPRER
jgi:hypothetical protein